jgi:hypothetical protein
MRGGVSSSMSIAVIGLLGHDAFIELIDSQYMRSQYMRSQYMR